MNRNEMIKWLSENTTQEQWFDRTTLFFIGESKSEYWETCNSDFLPVVHVRGYYNNHGAEPIYYLDVFEQPVFIDGAEYVLHFNDEPPRNAWYKLSTNEFHENMNRYPASDFGKHFTVDLVNEPVPHVPDYVLTGEGNINALSNYLKMNNASVDIVAGEALSRLKAQAVIVARVLKLNKVCQKHNIGHIGDSVIDIVIDYIEKQESLYERVVKALGKRKVPITGIDHLVGQVKTDHMKATLLDKVIEEFKIPEGGNIIKWLRKRTEKSTPDNFIFENVIQEVGEQLGMSESAYTHLYIVAEALSRLKEGERIHKAAEELIKSSFAHLGSLSFNPNVMNSNFHKLAEVLNIDVTRGNNVTPDTLESPSGYTINDLRVKSGRDPIKFEDSCTTTANLRAQPRNKYDREILPGVHVDVYDVLGAFKTDSAAIDHAVKKLLAPGQRGVKDRITDLNEAINSIQREIERLGEWDFVSSKPMSVNKIREAMGVKPMEGL